MRKVLAGVAAAVLAMGAAACGDDEESNAGSGSGSGSSGEPVKVGGLFDLSGGNSQIGQAARDGAQASVKRANANGGRPIELVVVDAKSDQTAAVQGARRLIEQDDVQVIIGPTSTPAAGAIKDYVNSRKIPLLANVGAIPGGLPEHVYKVPESDTLIARVQSAYMAKQGHKRVAFLGLGSGGFGQSGEAAFKKEGARVGLSIVSSETFELDDTNATAQLQRLRRSNPDAILIYAAGPPAPIAQRNARALGNDIPIYQSFGAAASGFAEQAGEDAEGTVLASPKIIVADQLPDSDPQKKALEEFQAAYPQPVRFAADAWDSVSLAERAIDQGGPEAAQIQEHLNSGVKDFVGVGGVRTMTPQDHVGIQPESIIIARVKDGKYELIATADELL